MYLETCQCKNVGGVLNGPVLNAKGELSRRGHRAVGLGNLGCDIQSRSVVALSVRMCARKGRTKPLEMVLTVFRQMKRMTPLLFYRRERFWL